MDEDVTVLQSAVGDSMETRIIGGASPGASSAASWNPALRATATSVLHPEVRPVDCASDFCIGRKHSCFAQASLLHLQRRILCLECGACSISAARSI